MGPGWTFLLGTDALPPTLDWANPESFCKARHSPYMTQFENLVVYNLDSSQQKEKAIDDYVMIHPDTNYDYGGQPDHDASVVAYKYFVLNLICPCENIDLLLQYIATSERYSMLCTVCLSIWNEIKKDGPENTLHSTIRYWSRHAAMAVAQGKFTVLQTHVPVFGTVCDGKKWTGYNPNMQRAFWHGWKNPRTLRAITSGHMHWSSYFYICIVQFEF